MSDRGAQIIGSALIAASGGVACVGGNPNSIVVGVVILTIFGLLFLRSCIVAEQAEAEQEGKRELETSL